MKQAHKTREPVAKTLLVATTLLLSVILLGCEAAGADEADTATTVRVRNDTLSPLKNVTIGDVAVGSFEDGMTADADTIEVTLPSAGTYTLSAEVDSGAGSVRTFSYEAEVGSSSLLVIVLPSEYMSVWIVDSSSIGNAGVQEYNVTYGSYQIQNIAPGSQQFLGIEPRNSGDSYSWEVVPTSGSPTTSDIPLVREVTGTWSLQVYT